MKNLLKIMAVAMLLIIVTVSCKKTPIDPEKEWVMIKGVKWATRNVDKPGTFAIKPEDPGMLYQWNKKVGWSTTDPMINSDGGTTWDDTDADGDTWEKMNDPCPTGWRMPTLNEQVSLASAISKWITLNGINGHTFGSGDNTLFLPAADIRDPYNGLLCSASSGGIYWSGSNGSVLGLNSSNVLPIDYFKRAFGLSVRCVAE